MSKKDYEKIAKVLRDTDAPGHVVHAMADMLSADYTGPYSFQYGKFIAASTNDEIR